MTPDELNQWIDRHFPGWGGRTRAARFLGLHRTSLHQRLSGKIPISEAEAKLMQAVDVQPHLIEELAQKRERRK